MNASELGSEDWWLVVLSMPPAESLECLQNYKASLLVHNVGTAEYLAAGKIIGKINIEIKRLNVLLSRSEWSLACKNVLPPELYEAVLIERARLQGDAIRTR